MPPEVNSGRMNSGPGGGIDAGRRDRSGRVAVELSSTATGFDSTITELVSGR